MSGKVRHDKIKPHSKKAKAKQRSSVIQAPESVAVSSEPVADALVEAPLEKKNASAASRTTTYPYVIAELKRIGIFAGAVVVILVVLAIILS